MRRRGAAGCEPTPGPRRAPFPTLAFGRRRGHSSNNANSNSNNDDNDDNEDNDDNDDNDDKDDEDDDGDKDM